MCPVKKGVGILFGRQNGPLRGGGYIISERVLDLGGVLYLCVGGFMAEGWGQGPDRGVGAGAAAEGTGGRR